MSMISFMKDESADVSIHGVSEEDMQWWAAIMRQPVIQHTDFKCVIFTIGKVDIKLFMRNSND